MLCRVKCWATTWICIHYTFASERSLTWNRLMSRGFPAFFRQFWLHFRKNLRKNLYTQRDRQWKYMYSTSIFNKTQIKQPWQTRLVRYTTLIHQLFMTKAVLYVKTAPGYWVRCYLVLYIHLWAAVTACHKLAGADAGPRPAAEACDGGCAVATMQRSVAIPASLNLSVRDHINSTCHALLIGWDGKYGYPHQLLMRDRGGRKQEGLRSKSVCVSKVGCVVEGARRPEKQKGDGWGFIPWSHPRGLKPDNFFYNWNHSTVRLSTLLAALSVSLRKKKQYQMNCENKQHHVQINRNPQKGENKTTTFPGPPSPSSSLWASSKKCWQLKLLTIQIFTSQRENHSFAQLFFHMSYFLPSVHLLWLGFCTGQRVWSQLP